MSLSDTKFFNRQRFAYGNAERWRFIVILIFLCVGTLAGSCIKEVNLEDVATTDKYVLNAYAVSDSLLSVFVCRTGLHTDTAFRIVEHAKLEIRDNFSRIDQLKHIGEGVYKTQSLHIEENYEYTLTAEIDGVELSATTRIPEKKCIIEAKFTTVKPDIEGNPELVMQITFDDSPENEDFYEIIVYKKNLATTTIDGIRIETRADSTFLEWYLLSESPVFLAENYSMSGNFNTSVFSDKMFTTSRQTMVFHYSVLFNDFIADHDLKIELRHVSREYYLYKKSLMKHFDNQESDFWYGIANPVSLYSNVKNGVGVFAGYASDTTIIYFRNSDFYDKN